KAVKVVPNGELGEILRVVAEYPQGWLNKPIDEEGQKQASWRTDPQQAGASGVSAISELTLKILADILRVCKSTRSALSSLLLSKGASSKTMPICSSGIKAELKVS